MVQERYGTSQVHQILLQFLKYPTMLITQIQKSYTHLLTYKLLLYVLCINVHKAQYLKTRISCSLFISTTLLYLPALVILPVTDTY